MNTCACKAGPDGEIVAPCAFHKRWLESKIENLRKASDAEQRASLKKFMESKGRKIVSGTKHGVCTRCGRIAGTIEICAACEAPRKR